MDSLQQLTKYINSVASDVRLKPTHIALYVALCQAWIVNNFKNTFHVSRRRLMHAAHIQSIVTYHKVINDLKVYGYLYYQPSSHPVKGSVVSLNITGIPNHKKEY